MPSFPVCVYQHGIVSRKLPCGKRHHFLRLRNSSHAARASPPGPAEPRRCPAASAARCGGRSRQRRCHPPSGRFRPAPCGASAGGDCRTGAESPAGRHRCRQQRGDAPFYKMVHRGVLLVPLPHKCTACLYYITELDAKGIQTATFFAVCVPFAPVCMLSSNQNNRKRKESSR